jgi:four helix bundle protein
MYTFSFERLEVWNKSRFLTKKIYTITKNFPDSEKFGITGQLRRAIISVCSNIAEGSSRKSNKDQVHFYNIAFSSLMETLNQLIICNDLEYIDAQSLSELRKEIHPISAMINNLCNSLGFRDKVD